MNEINYTELLVDLCESGVFTWRAVAQMAFRYMGEEQVADMCLKEGISPVPEEVF